MLSEKMLTIIICLAIMVAWIIGIARMFYKWKKEKNNNNKKK